MRRMAVRTSVVVLAVVAAMWLLMAQASETKSNHPVRCGQSAARASA